MIQLDRISGGAPVHPVGTLPQAREPLPLRRVRRVIEQDLDARLQDIFSSFDERPFAIASSGVSPSDMQPGTSGNSIK